MLAKVPRTVSRGWARGSPFPADASNTEARGSTSILAVWVDSRDTRIRGEPSASVATLTREENGWPVLRSSVARAPARVPRNSCFATAIGLKSSGGLAVSGRRLGITPGKATVFSASAMVPRPSKRHPVVYRHIFAPLSGLVTRNLAWDSSIHARKVPMATIALVDDDRNILTSVSIALEAEGYRIMTYTDGASALEGFKSSPPDLAILDIKMPRMDGMETLRRLRQKSDMPVIFLTSKDEEIDELFGLKMGADDFIRKPFSQRLLVEHVKAVLRRYACKDSTETKEADAAKVLERGQLRMDLERHTCTWKNEPVTLTVTEFMILQALATRPGVVKSRNALMDAAYDDQVYVDDRTIDSHIKRLRRKFKQVDDDFDMIETLYGVGYRFKEM